MRDPFAWSIPFGRLFGVTIRIHILFPFVAVALVLRTALAEHAIPGAWIDASFVVGLLFFSVLLHELGHCFGARWVHGEADKVLLWPLGGLAAVDVPHTPRANFITTIMGPAVNIVLAIIAAVMLWALYGLQPPWNPLGFVARDGDQLIRLTSWSHQEVALTPISAPVLLAQLFWVNYILALLNILLFGFPLDGGRMFQCIAWKYVGYHRGTLMAIYAGYVTMLLIGVAAIVGNDMLWLCLALFIYFACHQQSIQLEMGREDSLFGYDFSQGYTSLERDQEDEIEPRPKKRKVGWWKRWKQKREARRLEKEAEQKRAEEERLDLLLDKIQREGSDALTDEEKRFMMRVSDRYRNKQ